MLAIERHRKILEAARRDGAVRTQELSSTLNVTEETIRRDLDALARQRLLHRTHGGATEISLAIHELPQSEREGRQASEKTAIGKLAAKHVGMNETIVLDASSTAMEFARHLPEGNQLRIVSYAQDVIERLAIRSDLELVLLGGIYEPRSKRFGGMLTEMGIRSMRIDRFFFSGGGFDRELGIGEPNPDEARLKATIMAHAKWKCAMLDHTKLDRETEHYFVKPSDIDLLVTDAAGAAFFNAGGQSGQAVEVSGF